ncbi:PfkB family carbohydrate kinase [Arthrobacter sp. Sr24]
MRLLGAGDNVVDKYVSLEKMFPGGNAVNVAVFASRLGADTAYMGVLGDDDAGALVLKSLLQEGVQTDLVSVVPGPTAYAEVRHIDNDRVFIGSDRGVALFDPTTEQLDAMATFDVVHTAYSGSLASHTAAIAERTYVSFDFGGRFTRESAWPLLPNLYLATFSASDMSPEEARQLAVDAVAAGADYVLATCGSDGAFLATAHCVLFQEADQVVVRDTLGAGDAFIATVLVGLLSRRGLEETLSSASAHAGQVCMDYGAFGHGVAAKTSTAMIDTSEHGLKSQTKAGSI